MKALMALAAGFALMAAIPSRAAVTLYVAPHGADANPGTAARPFATLERARDAARAQRANGPVIVEVRAGTYELARPLQLTRQDSGVTWRASKVGAVRLVGGRSVRGWKPVTDPAVLARLDPAARGNVWQADLRAQGIVKEGDLASPPGLGGCDPGMEVFLDDRPMTIARWPNEGVAYVKQVVGGDYDKRDPKADPTPRFVYDGDRPTRWLADPDVMLHGWWVWDWSDQRVRVKSIDPSSHTITVDLPALQMRHGQWFYAYNLLSELDRPGEWYVDRKAGLLYLWPPSPMKSARVQVSLIPSLVTIQDASNVALRGFVMEACQGTAVTIGNGTDDLVAACTLRNAGGFGVTISGGKRCGVQGCDIYYTGDGGVAMTGGDEQTLTHCDHYADNNLIHHYSRWHPMYRPGVQMIGVGCRASHNLIHHAPHIGISFFGQENTIEYNELHNVVDHANDAGVMYTQPGMDEDWIERGNIIRYNYVHHIYGFQGKGCVGVYLDDCFSSMHCYGNLFYQVPQAAFIGGGRDSIVENNLFVDCKPAVHVDARGLGWAKGIEDYCRRRLASVPYTKPPWSTRYPELLTILANNPMAPMGNVFRRNVCWLGKWEDVEKKARPCITEQDNLIGTDPRVTDLKKLDFRLRKDSPAWSIGFQPIPLDKIGLYRDANRASWPVPHPWDPAPAAEANR
jgi:hypothetical protein